MSFNHHPSNLSIPPSPHSWTTPYSAFHLICCSMSHQGSHQFSSVTQSCPTLCDPMDHSLPSSSVHGILQARILEWSPRPPPGDLPTAGIELMSPALAAAAAKSLQSCVTLCDPIDGSPPGSTVPGILQARTLE